MQVTSKIAENWGKILTALTTNKNNGQKWSQLIENHPEMDFEESKKLLDYTQAAHAFLWTRNHGQLWGSNKIPSIYMQMRFDGYLGFPGGLIDPTDSSIVHGLNRELSEEMNFHDKYFLTDENYFFTSVNHTRKLVLHFFTKELSVEDYISVERESMNSHDFGGEVMGIVRPPLYDIKPGRGFNIFIQNQFVGNSLIQLLKAMNHFNILENEYVLNFINSS